MIASAFLIFLGGYIFYLKPQIMKQHLIHLQLIELEKKLKNQKEILLEYALSKEKVDRLKRSIFFDLEGSKNNAILSVISGQMLPQDLTTHYLKLGGALKKTVFFGVPVHVSVTGTYTAIMQFLYQIANLSYPATLQDFKWHFFDSTTLIRKNKQEITLLFHVYYPHSSAFNGANLQSFQIVKRHLLSQYSFNTLEMVGFLFSDFNGKSWGLVRVPGSDSDVHKVEVGNLIGSEQAYISEITDKKIVIQEKDSNKIIELSLKNRGTEHGLFLSS